MEYAMLSAVYAERTSLTGNPYESFVFYGDMDGDGRKELAAGSGAFVFCVESGRQTEYRFSEIAEVYYTDKNGIVYTGQSNDGGGYEQTIGDKSYECLYVYETISSQAAGPDVHSFFRSGLEKIEFTVDANGQLRYGQTLTDEMTFQLDGQEVSYEIYSDAYTETVCEAVHEQQVLDMLDDYLFHAYGSTMIRGDFDEDGAQESVFVVPGVLDPWWEHITSQHLLDSNVPKGQWAEYTGFPMEPFTGVIVADARDEQLYLHTYAVAEQVTASPQMQISYHEGYLALDHVRVFAPGAFGGTVLIPDATVPEETTEPFYGFIDLAGVSASSCLSEYVMTHVPERVIDNDLSTGWAEGASGNGEGESLTFTLLNPARISAIRIYAGYHKNEGLYYRNCRPAELEIWMDGAYCTTLTLADVFAEQRLSLPEPTVARVITVKILSVYSGSEFSDTVISELSFE